MDSHIEVPIFSLKKILRSIDYLMDISQMGKRLKQIEEARKKIGMLLDQREKLESTLTLLSEQLETLLVKERDKTEEIVQKEKLITDFKIKKKEVDAFLDDIEEFSDEDVARLRRELIDALLVLHPDQKNTISNLEEELRQLSKAEHECRRIIVILNKVTGHLDQIAEVRQRIRKRGIFSYIFGANPNAMISYHLLLLKQEINEELPNLELLAAETIGDNDSREIYAETIGFLVELRSQCEERWGYKKIDAIIAKATKKVEEFDRYFTAIKNHISSERERKMSQLNAWLEKCTSS